MTEIRTNYTPAPDPLERGLYFWGEKVGTYGLIHPFERIFEFRPDEYIRIPENVSRQFQSQYAYAHPKISPTGTICIKLELSHELSYFFAPVSRIFFDSLQKTQRIMKIEEARNQRRLDRILNNLDQIEREDRGLEPSPLETFPAMRSEPQ